MKAYLLSIAFLLVIISQIEAQIDTTKLIFDANSLTLTGHISDTIYGNRSYYYAIAPQYGKIKFKDNDSYISLGSGSAIKENGLLESKSYFYEGDTVYLLASNKTYQESDFSVQLKGGSFETAIDIDLAATYNWIVDTSVWNAIPVGMYDSILIQTVLPMQSSHFEYALSSDKTIMNFQNFAMLPTSGNDTLFVRIRKVERLKLTEYKTAINSPFNPFNVVVGHNDLSEENLDNELFWGQIISDADTFIRIDKPSDYYYMSNGENQLFVFINGEYTGISSCVNLIPVQEDDTITFYCSIYNELVSEGFDLNYVSDAEGNYENNPIYVEDNTDSVVLDFSQSEKLFISANGIIVYTENKEIRAPEKEFYTDSVYQSWFYRASRSVRMYTAPLGTLATLYFVDRPSKDEAITEADTNDFENEEMFSIVRYNAEYRDGKHHLISDGDLNNIIIDNSIGQKILSDNGEVMDILMPDGYCWVNTSGESFSWTRKYIDRSPGDYSTYFRFPDTISGPGCYQFKLYTDSLIPENSAKYYYIRYKVQERCTLEFEFNPNSFLAGNVNNPDQVFEPGEVSFLMAARSKSDSSIYCRITEHPVSKTEEVVLPDMEYDTLYVGNFSTIELDSLHNYMVYYEGNQPGILYYWLEGKNGDPFKGRLKYGNNNDSAKIIITSIKSYDIPVYNMSHQNLLLHTSFESLQKGDVQQYKKEAYLGLNTGTIRNFLNTSKYFRFTAPENATYLFYSDTEGVNCSRSRAEMIAGEEIGIDVKFDTGINDYAFSIAQVNVTDTVYRELILDYNYIDESYDFHTKNRIAYTYTAKDSGQLYIPSGRYGGDIYNGMMKHITSFPVASNYFDVVKDSTYVIVYNSLYNTKSLPFYLKLSDYGTTDNPIPAQIGFNYCKDKNGESFGRAFVYFSYKAERDGYLHTFDLYTLLDNQSLKDNMASPVNSLKCYKDSVYNIKVLSNREYWYLGYSEDGEFKVPDSLLVTEGTYELQASPFQYLGFYNAQQDGYLNIKMPGLGVESSIYIGKKYDKPFFVQQGEVYGIILFNYAEEEINTLTLELITYDEGFQNRPALAVLNSECSINEPTMFSALSTVTIFNEWDFNGDGITDSYERNPEYTFILPGEYTIRLITGNCEHIDTLYQTITIDGECEDVMFSLGDDFTLQYGEIANLTAANDAVWSTGFSGSTLNFENYTLKDTVETIWASFQIDSCILSDTINITYLSEQSSAVEEEYFGISVYPTLVTDHLVVDTKGDQLKSVSVYNNQSVCVFHRNCHNQFETLYLSHLSQGYYIVVVHTTNEVEYFKILKR